MKDFNLTGLDFRAEAEKLQTLDYPIVDFHSHIHGKEASKIYKEVAELYGIKKVYSMSALEDLDDLRTVLGDMLEPIAFPKFRGENPEHDHGEGYLERIKGYHSAGAKIVKFWAAPRGKDFAEELGVPGYLDLDTPYRQKGMELACVLGMSIMVHVADPNTWFQTKYADSDRYGTKEAQYEPLRKLLEKYPTKWIAAHMGGYPEDLSFLSELLSDHPNLYLDSSATKWIVREMSKHPSDEVTQFFTKWKGRLLFGSDIVTTDDHLSSDESGAFNAHQAEKPEEAFELYASRYFALRTLWETDKEIQSPIADPDLALIAPEKHKESDSPAIRGKSLSGEVLKALYFETEKKEFC